MKPKIYLTTILATLCLLTPGLVSAVTLNKTLTTPSLNTGLVGWWTFDGVDQATTVTSSDKSGNGNDAGKVGGVTPINGRIGQAMKFNGTTGYTKSGLNKTAIGNTLTISLWIKPTGAQDTIGIFQIADSLTALSPWILFQRYPARQVRWFLNGGYQITETAISDNTWTHIVLTYDGTTWRAYKNGVADGIYVGAIGINNGGFTWLGNGYNGYFGGSIDDVRIYNRALSALEIRQLYQMGAGTKTNKTEAATPAINKGLQGWWTFDGKDVSATKVFDMSGNGRNGTKSGAAAAVNGRIGQAAKFKTNTVSVGDVGIPINGPATVSGWFKFRQFATTKGSYNGMFGYLGQHNANNFLYFLDAGADYFAVASVLKLNTWQHIAYTYNGTHETALLYINGVKYSPTIQTPNTNNGALSSFVIGNSAGAGIFDGNIDDVRVYNRVLSYKEINQLYQMGASKINKTDTKTYTLNTGLVGWWTFDGADQATTVTSSDKSGNGNNAGKVGGVTPINGRIGQAMKFDGTTGYANTAKNVSTFITASTGTISVWAKPTGSSPSVTNEYDGQVIIGEGSPSPSYGYLGIYRATVGGLDRIWAQLYDTGDKKIGIPYTNNKWIHLVWVHSNGNLYAYANGNLVSSIVAGNVGSLGNTLKFGIGLSPYNLFFSGSIDDVRIYNRALSAKEVMQLYQMGK